MTKKEFRDRIKKSKLILDGATGSNLQKRGMPVGVCPEEWIIENSDVLKQLQIEYIQAGSDVLYAPTFSGNRIKLEEYGLDDKLLEINTKLVEISKAAVEEGLTDEEKKADRKVYIAGDITMTGKQVYPVGPLMFEELVDIYKEQIKCIVDAGIDFIVVETMMSLQECRAAVIAAKEVCELPVMVTLTFNEDGRTLYGTNPETAALVMTTLGADAVGVNCSTGPDKMIEIVKTMTEYADIPIVAKPNAGLPKLEDGVTVYDMGPEEFAKEMMPLVEAGADVVGGCCGTTPEHIKLLNELLIEKGYKSGCSFEKREGKVLRRALSTERNVLPIDLDGDFLIIGERINPTGKKALQAQLREGSLDMVCEMAESQEEFGASILDVNMGMNGIDEKEMMLKCVNELTLVSNLPLSIDSSHPSVVEAALRIYPGRALINSISLEPEKFEKLIPIAKKYGAMFILLPLSDAGLPKDLDEKKTIIHTILDEAKRQGMAEEDIVVDGLVATIGANKNAALEVLETIRYCKNELGVATICGLSNISFGLPERVFVNTAFLTLAIGQGLTMAIANPSQTLLVNAALASDLLLNKEEADLHYINGVAGAVITQSQPKNEVAEEDGHPLYLAVVKGKSGHVLELVEEELKKGTEPSEIIDKYLIAAINYVGELFEQKKYFLPQLIASAETMEKAINRLEPLLEAARGNEKLATIVVATVKGDIHDIGKNLVALMLKNYGYHVIDLGKDVETQTILDTAKAENASIIGLSALMTTTMMEMKEVVDEAKKQGVKAKIIIGGAVVTESFAEEIGADGYSADAREAVKVVNRLLEK